jgi:hypothetical protein
MTVEQALQIYSKLTKDIFYRKQPFWKDGSYKADKLKDAVCDTVQKYGSSKNKDELLIMDDPRCKV